MKGEEDDRGNFSIRDRWVVRMGWKKLRDRSLESLKFNSFSSKEKVLAEIKHPFKEQTMDKP